MQTAYITHPECLLHDMGPQHPECPTRLTAINDQLIASGLLPYLIPYDAPEATDEQLARVHSRRHIAAIRAMAPSSGRFSLDADTAMNQHTLAAALRSAGAAVLATELVMQGKIRSAFCCVRPPGHHAERERAMGFSFFNNVAVGIAQALERHGLERVAVVDFDAHHGNGTEDIFRDDPRVLMVSTFLHPYFPFSGTEGRSAHMVNIPLPPYSGGDALRRAVTDEWLPALEIFQPQLIFFSAGFDGHREDDMALFKFTEADYAWLTREIKRVGDRYADGRLISVLEGGYELHALGRSVAAHVKVLADL